MGPQAEWLSRRSGSQHATGEERNGTGTHPSIDATVQQADVGRESRDRVAKLSKSQEDWNMECQNTNGSRETEAGDQQSRENADRYSWTG